METSCWWASCCHWSDSLLLYLSWMGWRCCGAVAYLLTPGVRGAVSELVILFQGPAPLLYTIVLVKPLKWRYEATLALRGNPMQGCAALSL